MSLKQNLKAAKSAIAENDPESALYYVQDVLAEDAKNYYAYIFQGKAYQLLDDVSKAITSFSKATKLEPENLLGWKGYFQLVRNSKDYLLVFEVFTSLIKVQVDQGIGIADSLKDLTNWLDFKQYKSDNELLETYLRAILPGTPLGELVGGNLGRAESNIKTLINLERRKVDSEISVRISKERVKFGRVLTQDGKNHLNSISYSIYQNSDLDRLYDLILNVSNDDNVRRQFEEDYLKYKYNLLQVCPEKAQLVDEIKEMIDGMLLIGSKSLFCWNLYFDWLDMKSLKELDFEKVIQYLQNFPNQGLSVVLHAYLMSDISTFDKERVVKAMEKPKKLGRRGNRSRKSPKEVVTSDKEAETPSANSSPQSNENKSDSLLPGEVLSLMLEGLKKSSDSLLVNRIVCEYYIHAREYFEGSQKCRELIKILADMQRNIGLDLKRTKESALCSLAITYTYYEAPKNFPRALELYERILTTDPSNSQAMIGIGLISIEKGELEKAKGLLEEVTSRDPENQQASREYSWCLIKLGDHEKGRELLLKCLAEVKGQDLYSGEIRALIYWRLSSSLLDQKNPEIDYITEAYNYLIQSLKDSQNFAPSYTLLGVIFQEHYDDKPRAHKCFYKAFELDVSEIVAAKYLVDDLTSKNEWEVAEILCNRLVTSENARRILLSEKYKDSDKAWAYRVLGCAALNKQDDPKAIEWFQTALRMAAIDIQCWIGLGEAYMNCGRLDAAAKVFRHLITINDQDDENQWVIEYMLGTIVSQMGEFNEGLYYLGQALNKKPEEECILIGLYESYIENSKRLVLGGFFGRSVQSNLKALEYIKLTFKVNPESPKLWKSFGESLKLFLVIQEKMDLFPIEALKQLFEEVDLENNLNDLAREALRLDSVTFKDALDLFELGQTTEAICSFIILTQKLGLKYLPSKVSKYLKSVAIYNLGLAYLESYNYTDNTTHRDYSVKFFKNAIQLEGNNSAFWVGLGNAYVSLNPHISQHCFIKGISLESRDAGIWTNLAALYLRYGDSELAQDAFLRAQSVAPQESKSWLGHALAAEASNDEEQAARLFTHAFVLSNGRSPLAQLLYGVSIINKRGQGSDPRDIESAQEYSVANFAMQQYLKFAPNDVSGLQIALTISERCKNFDMSIEIGERLCQILEKDYDRTESEVTFKKYVGAKTQLSRIYLGLGKYEKALENAQLALDLINSSEDEQFDLVVLSSRVVIGLALFFSNEFDESLEHLKVILESHGQSKRLITLIAQILYAHGTEETKQAALDQLFAFIEENGSSLIVVLTLGAISLADGLEDYFVAIKEELEGLSLEEVREDAYRSVPKMLIEINKHLEVKLREWQKAAIMFPSDFNVWQQLNSQMALSVASLRETKLTAPQLSKAYLASGHRREIQRSMLICPGDEETMQALGSWAS
ncbi:TPR-like protein [Suhomyces tanzawaensis NRRL Y-17324]|uniref:TPR-like protein n=1 Tax=Suhomyces tanzawaensis NRRL Y-17324 TaxID=984487 RepID=A0A1E4SRJ8_9ASCO|nr:TPR-like protein [Suhomyces tanzawaensis NRRL Y-17324]ODV82131.1 TPR-like protein [Suhomyces tanzawaensis NRRL Y-17324]